MDKDEQHFVEQYRQALHDYVLSNGDEAALLQAYDMGRQVLANGQNVVDLVMVHQAALLSSVLGPLLAHEAAQLAAKGEAFLQQALVPFEIARRGITETITDLHLSKEALEQRVAERTKEIQCLNAGLEQRVTERTRQLEAANEELEAFAYSVSHDLRAPLRAINGFARILLEQHAPRLDADLQRYLHLVRDNAQHMGRLIDDLLAFSRLSRQPLNTQPVALAVLVHSVLADLQVNQDERKLEVVIGGLPTCQADPMLLKQVYVNLLSNALKFTQPRVTARIEIGAYADQGQCVYYVKDNGVGFDMQYATKLFGVFQRLHRAEEFEGTGVGLAIVQRIIHRHGGRVWAEAAVDQGAAFYFTLVEAHPLPEDRPARPPLA
jgi:light-regulated signal transduction histidine kinase (bacteriophytochrome)